MNAPAWIHQYGLDPEDDVAWVELTPDVYGAAKTTLVVQTTKGRSHLIPFHAMQAWEARHLAWRLAVRYELHQMKTGQYGRTIRWWKD
jgi:hypothetical protein